MGAQSSVEAQGDAPQSSMRPGWPQGQPPDMVWGSDRGLQATLQDGSVDDLDAALLEAVADGDAEATAALLAAGANVNHLSVQHDWASPAILAAQEGSLDCLNLLLATRSDGGGALLTEVDRADRFGMTAAHTAAHWDRRDCLHALLVAGADVSLRAKGAGTAAHVAAARDNEACLQVLLEHGASRRIATGLPLDAMRVDALDRDGRSVYELAVQSGSDKCVRVRG